MSDKETIQQISGFGLPFTGDDIPWQNPEWGISAEYTDSSDGYKYFSAMKLPKPVRITSSYVVLDVFKFLTDALCRRFHPDGSEEVLNPFTGDWSKK